VTQIILGPKVRIFALITVATKCKACAVVAIHIIYLYGGQFIYTANPLLYLVAIGLSRLGSRRAAHVHFYNL